MKRPTDRGALRHYFDISHSVVVATMLMWGCGKGTPVEVKDPTVSTVTVTPGSRTLTSIGQTVQVDAQAAEADGTAISGQRFTWASSDAAVATVSSSGLVTAVGGGTAGISATAGGVAGTATVIVEQVVASIVLDPGTATLTSLGETTTLVAEARDAGGTAIAGTTFVWASTDEATATISDLGEVTALDNGTTTVTATADGVSGEATVEVAQAVHTVEVTPASATVEVDSDLTLEAEATDALGGVVAGAAVVWSSGDEEVATVDVDGLVTGVGAGETTVTATVDGVSGETAITVVPMPDPPPLADFVRTPSSYAWDTSDMPAACSDTFGPAYRMADWNDIVAYVALHGLAPFYDDSGMGSYRSNGWVSRGGQQFYSADRRYFAERHDGQVPAGWLAHASISGHAIDLGSWVNSRPILCYTPGS